jgi:hypothetical protein
VTIYSEGTAGEAVRKLRAAEGIDIAMGPGYASFPQSPNPEPIVTPGLATLEADSAEAAASRVREVVGDGCDVGPAEQVTDDG